MALVLQVVSTILLCCSCMNLGIMQAWPSSTVLLFKSTTTPLHRPMDETEISLCGSLPAMGALLAHPLVGLMLDRLGRKKSVLFTSMIFVLSWCIIALSNYVEAILFALLISGLGCTVILETTIYIGEICQESIRGTMTAFPLQFYSLGFLVSYFLGGCLTYQWLAYTCLCLSVVGVLMILLLKESPLTLMVKGRLEEASQSIAFYRSKKATSREVFEELEKMRLTLSSYNRVSQSPRTVEDHLELTIEEPRQSSCWQLFKSSKSTQREFYLILMLQFAFIFQGMPVFLVYAEPLFTMTVPNDVISPNLLSVLSGVVSLVFGLIAGFLTDIVGRRPLMLYCSILAGFCCLVLGTQMLTEWGPSWIVPLFIYTYIAFYTMGAGTVPMVILAEIFSPEVKSILSMLALEWTWGLDFLILFLFNLLLGPVGVIPIFYFFSFVCITSAVFCYFYLPEMKGLPVYAIQELFIK